MEYLANFFVITIYYYNPNIHPQKEYERRLHELKDFMPRFPPATQAKLHIVEAPYDTEDFFSATKARETPELQSESEKGERCRRCYAFRLAKSYAYAAENGFDFITTTLSISPYKDAEKLNTIGHALEQEDGPHWLASDFKKKGGYLRSLELSKEYGLYRQDYCGCIYSKINIERERASNEK